MYPGKKTCLSSCGSGGVDKKNLSQWCWPLNFLKSFSHLNHSFFKKDIVTWHSELFRIMGFHKHKNQYPITADSSILSAKHPHIFQPINQSPLT